MSTKDRKIAALEHNNAQQATRIEELTAQLNEAKARKKNPNSSGLPKNVVEALEETTDAVVVEIRLIEQDPEHPEQSMFRFESVGVMMSNPDLELTHFEKLEGAVTAAVDHYLDSLEVQLRHMKES